jgi:hypothetical protein
VYQDRMARHSIITIPIILANRLHGEAKRGGDWRTQIKWIKLIIV